MEDPHNGLVNRIRRGLAPNAVSSQIEPHQKPYRETQGSLRQADDFYKKNGCGGGGPSHSLVDEYLERPFPSQADWEKENGRPMPEYSPEFPQPVMERVGKAVWNALPSAEAVCMGTFTAGGTAIGGAGGFVGGGLVGAGGGTLVAPGIGTVAGGATFAVEGAVLGGTAGTAIGYGVGDYLCR